MNPLLELGHDIPFDTIRPEHVEPAVEQLIASARRSLAAIAADASPPTYDNTLGALEDATEPLERAMAVVGHLHNVATNDALRAAYNAVDPLVSELASSIPLDAGLYRRLVAFSQSEEASRLPATRRRFLDKKLREFRRNGAELDEDGKAKLRDLDVSLSKLTTRFSQNVLDATNAFEIVVTDEPRLTGLPPSALAAARASAAQKGVEGFRFTLQAPSLVAVLMHADDASLRETLWRAYDARASGGELDNGALIGQILALRTEKARLLGYRDFADFVLEERMAKGGAKARAFVDDLTRRTRPFFAQEADALRTFRRELEGPDAPELAPWDAWYYAEKLRKARYDFDDEELRPYFAADRVLEGLFAVVQRLYGVTIEPQGAPAWHESVRCYRIADASGRVLGGFYVDLFPRESKRGGAWMGSFVTGGPAPDGTFAPHLGVFCANVTPPLGDRPALLTHSEVETIFHEFGHLMHHCLSEVDVKSLAGTAVAWDFVELPSQIMENWTWERAALDLFAQHHETGEPIPEPLFDKLRRARTFRAASAMMRQLGFAHTDLALHVDYDAARDGDAVRYARACMQPFSVTRLPDDYAMICGFNHLFASPIGYAAGYYSYKWAEVLDADAFTRFVEHGVFSARVGRELREKILARGDSADPDELFRDFMGREPSVDALLVRSGLHAA